MRYIISNATIVKANGERKSVYIHVEDKKIARISTDPIALPANQVDLSGYTVLPGFINGHVHLMECYDGFNDDKLKQWLMSGITYLRDEGIMSRHTAADAVAWRDRNSKSCMVPGIAVCGKFISSVNGYGGVEPLCVTSEEEAREAVRQQVGAGVDHIKVPLDDGYSPYTQSMAQLPLSILTAICDESHKLGKKVSAHVTRSDKLKILLKAGIDEAAHTCFDKIPDETLAYMVENSIYMTPTLCIYGEITANYGAPVLYQAMDNTKRFVDMGGCIGFGNDYIEEKAIWSPVGMPIMEMELLRNAGLTMKQIIDAATIGNAKILDRDDLGRIEENCIADLIAVKGNPYELPYLLSNVDFVMKDGIVVKGDV